MIVDNNTFKKKESEDGSKELLKVFISKIYSTSVLFGHSLVFSSVITIYL